MSRGSRGGGDGIGQTPPELRHLRRQPWKFMGAAVSSSNNKATMSCSAEERDTLEKSIFQKDRREECRWGNPQHVSGADGGGRATSETENTGGRRRVRHGHRQRFDSQTSVALIKGGRAGGEREVDNRRGGWREVSVCSAHTHTHSHANKMANTHQRTRTKSTDARWWQGLQW